MSDRPVVDVARPWHLVVPDAGEADHDDTSEAEGTEQPLLPPLWFRILSGRSFAWRWRRARHSVRRARRQAARRALRWLELRPVARDAVRAGNWRLLVGLQARRRQASKRRPHRPVVHVEAEVVGGTDRRSRSLLVAGVSLRPSDATDAPRLVIDDDGSTAVVSRPGGEQLRLVSPVDPTRWNPNRFPERASSDVVALDALPMGDDARSARRRLQFAHRARVVDVGTKSDAADAVLVRRVAELACAGVVLGGTLRPSVAEAVGPELARLVARVDLRDPAHLVEGRSRLLHSIEVRRAASSRFAPRDQWTTIGAALGVDVRATPSVSVLLASNRPDRVVEAVDRVVAQRGVDVQLVVGLHGSHMPTDLDAAIADRAGGVDLVVRRLDDAMNLGEVLNDLTSCADGDLVSKWDDDDWYDSLHLSDLVRALDFSGAVMVGKAAEFVYLEALDVTIRRFAAAAERLSVTLAGGTLLLARDDLVAVGWAPVARQVDRQLIDKLQDLGFPTYRTHGFGYVLRRQGSSLAQHTWQAGDGYFLRQGSDQRPGLDLGFAGFDEESLS
ncbi:MAG: glycosyltransferase [Ilumatobacteraceae bacterium]